MSKHITCDTCGHHTVTDNTAPKLVCGNCWADLSHLPIDAAQMTCGNCNASWCDRCDPAPGALCHTCHGRGYSIAPMQ